MVAPPHQPPHHHHIVNVEPIVDLARLLGVPFAVVPCCVFPDLFPFRFLELPAAGKKPARQRVRQYQSFVRYLLAKETAEGLGAARLGVLPFLGKNKVVYAGGREE